MSAKPRLHFVYVGPTARRDAFMWSDGAEVPVGDEHAREAVYAQARLGQRPGNHLVRVGDSAFTDGAESISVEVPLPGTDVHGRPLKCAAVFDRIAGDGKVRLPADDLVAVLHRHGYRADSNAVARHVRLAVTLRAVHRRRWAQVAVGLATLAALGGAARSARRKVRGVTG